MIFGYSVLVGKASLPGRPRGVFQLYEHNFHVEPLNGRPGWTMRFDATFEVINEGLGDLEIKGIEFRFPEGYSKFVRWERSELSRYWERQLVQITTNIVPKSNRDYIRYNLGGYEITQKLTSPVTVAMTLLFYNHRKWETTAVFTPEP